MKTLFEYTDYRKYLKDYYQTKKLTEKGFSHRVFLNRAGLTGPNFLKNVIDNKKNLSPASIKKFAKALELNKDELKYFTNLVLFCQAKKIPEKRKYFNKLSEFATKSEAQTIQKNQMEYFSHWYNIVVREHIHAHGFSGNFKELANALYPQITENQARKAVELLTELDMIYCDSEGNYYLREHIITTGPELKSIGARAYHKNMIQISEKAIDDIPLEKRYYRTITGSYSEETFEKIKLEVDKARERILDLIKEDEGAKKVFQINMQLFPLETEPKRRKKGSSHHD